MAVPTDGLILVLRYKRLAAEYFARGLDAHAAGAFTLDAGQLAVVETIHRQVAAQVAELERVLGAAAPAAPDPATYDFTGGGEGGGAPFGAALGAEGGAPYTGASSTEFFKLAQLFGDFGVRLVLGQLPVLRPDPVALAAGAGIHVTSGRHAAELRIMRGGANRAPIGATTTAYTVLVNPWVSTQSPGRIFDIAPLGFSGDAADATTQAAVATLVYGVAPTGAAAPTTPSDSEANQVQMGFAPYSAEAFDEPLSTAGAEAVLARFVRIA